MDNLYYNSSFSTATSCTKKIEFIHPTGESCGSCTQGWSSTSSLPSLIIAAVQVTNARFPLRQEPQARTKVHRGAHFQKEFLHSSGRASSVQEFASVNLSFIFWYGIFSLGPDEDGIGSTISLWKFFWSSFKSSF